MKTQSKRYFLITKLLILGLTVILLALSGCSAEPEEKRNIEVGSRLVELAEEYQNLLITPLVQPYSDMVVLTEEGIVFAGRSEDETAVYHKKLTGDIPEAIEANLSGTIQKLCYDEEKKVVYEILNSSDTFFLTGHSCDGEVILAEKELPALTQAASGLRDMCACRERIAVIAADSVLILDETGEEITTVPCPGEQYVSGCFFENQLYLTYRSDTGEVRLTVWKDGQKKPDKGTVFVGAGNIFAGRDGILCFDEKYLYSYQPDREELIKKVDLFAHDISYSRILAVENREEDAYRFVCWDMGQTEKPVELLTLAKRKEGEQESREIVRIAGVAPSMIELVYGDIITGFNRQSKEYKVVIDNINTADRSMDEVEALLISRMMSKDSPDILIMHVSQNYEAFAQKGLFADLKPYLDQSTVFSLDSFEEYTYARYCDGEKVYGIPKRIGLLSFGVSGDKAGETPGWTVDEFLDYYQDNIKIADGWTPDREEILQYCLMGNMDQYVDVDSKKAYFDGDSFRSLLKRVKELNLPKNPGAMEEQGFLETRSISTFGGLENILMYQCGESFTHKGYPNDSGRPVYYLDAETMHILENSRQKDGAYAFWEYYMQERNLLRSDFSTVKGELEQELGKCMEPHTYLDEEMKPFDYALSRKQADNLLTALSGATFESYDSKQIQEIILEEAESYFAGQKPLEEVCENMQKRVQLFLDE